TALAMVAEHPNELVRDQFLVTVSDRTRQDPERLRPRLEALVRSFVASGGKEAGASKPAPGGQPGATDEAPPWEPDQEATFDQPPTKRDGPGHRSRPGGRPGAVAPGGRAGRDALVLAVREPGAMAGRLHEALFADPLQ